MKRSLLDILFDLPPKRLDNGMCADCQFLGSRQLNGAWSQRLYKACDWHIRHSDPWGPDYQTKRIIP